MSNTPLKPYPAYMPAGVPWLQQVPEHWEVSPGLSHLRFKQEKNKGMVEKQVLSLSYGRIVIKPKEKLTGLVPESFETYQIVGPGDIIVRATDLQNDRTSLRIGEVKDRGIITSAYLCLNVHNGMVPSFGYYLIHAYDLMKVLYGFGSGLRQNLDWKDFKRMPLAVPPPEEQHLIVRYLHALDAKVKRYIRTKRTLIARLQEQKQAIIQRAVTRGLDPNVKLKPSGVEWLGEVPEHWEVLRCRFLFREIDKRSIHGKETHLSMSQTLGLVPSEQVENRTLVSESYAGGKLCATNDLVLNRLKAHLGVFALAPQEGVICPDYSVFRGKRPMVMRYFEQVLRSPDCRHELRIRAKGIVEGFWRLYTDDFNDIFLPVPPVDEQAAILSAMDEDLKGVHEAIRRIENEIALMQEYHTRLIADVVTGAVDVREAAKTMEDVAPVEEALADELELETEVEEELDTSE